ncbi:hypothetical protein [Nocardia cyriacigeorgica]|uniref:hypothetical protein n=1 Tax=Nocardia cyriacigeorgica TaxID=135487 RepID=UPI0024564B6F|nr:hypothetical protein [Nocardia cyriacigeorgica]
MTTQYAKKWIPMGTDLRSAVEELHVDLATWLGSEADDSVFERFAAAQHPAFSMVTTSGEILRRRELLDGLRGARNTSPGMHIVISEFEELAGGSDTVVRFLESHHHAGQISRRRVTAVLVPAGGEPGLQWLTVHETPLAAD